MDYDDTVRIRPTAPMELWRGALASVIGITASGDRRGEHWDQFPPGTVYFVEFEDGETLDVHESWVELAEAQVRNPPRGDVGEAAFSSYPDIVSCAT